jgi:Tfp pilus assembly protein PilE
MHTAPRRHQTGITLIGFVLLAAVFGIVIFAGMKVFPLYLERARIGTVLSDLQAELATGGNSPQQIKIALDSRFYVENLQALKRDEYSIERSSEGFQVSVHRESRTPFLADLSFIMVIDEQVEIAR